ncbi:hypothetical protein N7532_004380 [Penicillium argentinense]|uniref:SH3 domain-containing protein n=1 Tax=Penicillium argentinense TaxID=1131581 RepID=A0A9W9FP39_9EURO|nr:uncharacterized protein N7532_004380 [Penicillium argentinense]KAJ5103851.1 hypothetical protein N7532_004380 [Penicillium argentinense]
MSSPAPANTSGSNLQVLPPILTNEPVKHSPSAKDRLSTYSNVSFTSQNRSRPGSHVFPIFHSSLSYTLVRDFAYPSIHPLHYGPPPPRGSGVSTPASEYRRLSDPPGSWDTSRGPWASGPWSTESSHGQGHQQLPAMSFGDGPPYSEDEDLHSPVVTTARQRKKSTGTELNGDEQVAGAGLDRGTYVGMNADGSETYYVNSGDPMEDGPGGEYVTYPANQGRHSYYGSGPQWFVPAAGFEPEEDYTGGDRYSNDYQFAVGCPDEEMHGKAVALFDFTREHENELPLTEGQVIYVSYRHGQGWLVAEDPKTGENGLVPEEFVRLLRDIEGGLTSLNGEPGPDIADDSASLSIDTSEDSHDSTPVNTGQSTPTPNQGDHHGANGNTPVTISVGHADEPDTVSESKTSGGGNRSSQLAKT